MPRIIIQYCTVGLILFAVGATVYLQGKSYLHTWSLKTLSLTQAQEFRLEYGEGLQKLSEKLERQGLVSSAFLFHWWARLTQPYRKFQAGLYRFEHAVSPQDISSTLAAGKIYTPIALQFTIPEGFTSHKIYRRLSSLGVAPELKFYELEKNEAFRNELAVPGAGFEGFLYPATYTFAVFPSPKEALAKMVATFFERLPKNFSEQLSEYRLSLHDAVTFASLIEAETMFNDERPMVSEVIWGRLRHRMALAIDASIIYGISDFDGNLRASHLKDKSNPYNTRVHPGLPPGPICSPALASLEAVFTPSNEGYLYYVLKGDGSGRHVFTKSLSEHNTKVREFLRLSRERKKQQEQQQEMAGGTL